LTSLLSFLSSILYFFSLLIDDGIDDMYFVGRIGVVNGCGTALLDEERRCVVAALQKERRKKKTRVYQQFSGPGTRPG